MTDLFCGLDAGSKGGICVIEEDGLIATISFGDKTEATIAEFLQDYSKHIEFAVIEKVWGRLGDTPKTAGVLCQSYGFLRGLLVAFKIPFTEAPPMRWQTKLDCVTGGVKSVSKQRIEQLYPHHRWTLGTADAGCIAHYARLLHSRNGRRDLPDASEASGEHRPEQDAQIQPSGAASEIKEWSDQNA